jgi:hypothetical protein
MANNSGSNPNKNQNLNSSIEQFEVSNPLSQLSISQAGSESKLEAGSSNLSATGSALGQQGGEKSPHINQYWQYSQLPSTTISSSNQSSTFTTTNQSVLNTSTSTGTVFSRGQDRDNVSPPARELSTSCAGLIGPSGIISNANYRQASNNLPNNQFDALGHGHFFTKKTFHRPTYCNHCTDLLWLVIK